MSKRLLHQAFALGLLASLAAIGFRADGIPVVQSTGMEHERLRLQNTFKTPEEVVRYYCARDASGFVWSGLLDSERRAFTLWKDVPQAESFYIAKRYEIIPVPVSGKTPDLATVEVRYEVIGLGDANGALIPSKDPIHKIVFDLKKVGGQWKIARPDPSEVAPVVLQSKFPFVAWGSGGSSHP